jgi:ribosomal protein S6E (S10)
MKTYGEVNIKFYTLLTLTLDGGKRTASFALRQSFPGNRRWYSLVRRLGEAQNRFERGEKRKIP